MSSSCTFACNGGYSACNGACVDEQTDSNNCGGCGSTFACTGGMTCSGGSCACASPTTNCGGTCVNTQTNIDYCGGCSAAPCTTSVSNATPTCSGGSCSYTCNSGYTACNGGCANFSNDDNNCGSCGATCSGTCTGGTCEIPFAYTPSNFAPSSYTPPSGATTDCNATYSSTSHTFTTGSCTGTAPTIHSSVSQSGGPAVDVLVFNSLTIASGSTLKLVGTNPVILAVYGNVVISGTISANASGTTPGAGGDNTTYCATAPAGTGGNNGASGGGGAGMAVAGGEGSCGGQNCGSPTIAGGAVDSIGSTLLGAGAPAERASANVGVGSI